MFRNITDELMQSIAAEINLSETAFITTENDDYENGEIFGLRWFTPTNEVRMKTVEI